jgi:Tol biopolymer transport system component
LIGKTLAHFSITAKLGEGGMGEVYRGEDTKLGRQVAIKVLPEAVASDPERLARFEREAKVLASLNHPNIAGIHQVEQADGVHFLVMELAEGETLSERIARGPIPLEQATAIALQIAEALEAAHERGIIHRDLKPANVNISADGQVKVLDFGLAKALGEERDAGDIANSPTLTAAATQAGIIMGTAAYMSPEQAAGAIADRRSDIWSFGVVLAEMLTGKQQFEGQTVSHVLASVLKDEPDLGALPAEVPARLRELIERCLRKEPKLRLQAIGDARVQLQEYRDNPADFDSARTGALPGAVAPVSSQPLWLRALPWALLLVSTLGLAGAWWRASRPGPTRPVRTVIELPEALEVFGGYGSSVVVSPDGTEIAYVMQGQGKLSLYLRALDQWEPRLVESDLTGSGSPYHPFFSPDGKWLGFVTPTELKKVPIQGGSSITLCNMQLSRGASWSEDGSIVFAASPTSGLSRVPAAGGDPEPLTELAEGEVSHRWPQVLPGGRAVLFVSATQAGDYDEAVIEVLNLETRERTVLHQGGTYPRYVGTGHVIYVREGTLFAIPFDLDRLQATGSAFPVLEGVGYNRGQGGAHYDVSGDGELVYVGGAGEVPGWEVLSVDAAGGTTPIWAEEQLYRSPRLSPDGSQLALDVWDDSRYQIWVVDLERQVPTRLTFSNGNDTQAVWTPDNQFVIFASDREGHYNLYRKPADGSGEAEKLTTSESSSFAWSISPDGRTVAYADQNPETSWDIWLLPLDGSGDPEPFLQTEAGESDPDFSPDGRWIAHDSNESGTWEVYVRPATGDRGKWQVSVGGGDFPRWARDGRELYYRSPGGEVMRVQIDLTSGSLRANRPEVAIPADFVLNSGDGANYYDVAADGESFVLFRGKRAGSPDAHSHALLIQNWFDELEAAFRD